MTRFLTAKKVDDIQEAIAVRTRAVQLIPDGHAMEVTCSIGLATAIWSEVSYVTEDVARLDEAIRLYSKIALSRTGPASQLLDAAKSWAGCYSQRYGESSLDAHKAILALIPRVVWLGTGVSSRLESLLSLGDVVNNAASVAFQLQRYDLAIEWLEQGRSIVWGQIRRLRSLMDDLRNAHPGLADELMQVSKNLEQAADTQPSEMFIPLSGDTNKGALERKAQAHRRTAERYETLLENVRQLPGFEQFLQTKRLSELQSAAAFGAVAMVNVHTSRCDAVVLRDSSSAPTHVFLPSLTVEIAQQLHKDFSKILESNGVRFRECHEDARHLGKEGKKDKGRKPNMIRILATLWTSIAQPIIEALELQASEFRKNMTFISELIFGSIRHLQYRISACHTSLGV